MKERQLENVMLEFIDHRVDLLVCTTIIESGLDIPNANTMIINRADHFGLAQLYQLRGRVGRSRQKAYAYLLIPGEHIITRDAKKRIDALRELVETESGGGFKLAIRDLEHRGAGNLLGREQSGQITAVGFELYTEMMEQAIHELRGEPLRPDFEPELRLGIPPISPTASSPTRASAWYCTGGWRGRLPAPISTGCARRCATGSDRRRRWSTICWPRWICAGACAR